MRAVFRKGSKMKIRRTGSLILALVMCFTMTVQAAVVSAYEGNFDEVYKAEPIDTCQEIFFRGDTYVKSEEFDDIYEDGNQYVMVIKSADEGSTQSVIIPVDRKNVEFSNAAAVEAFMSRENIPKEAIDSFNEKYQLYLEADEENIAPPALVLFEPAEAMVNKANGDPDQITYYTYNGWPMMTYQFNYTNLSSNWKTIKTGTATKDTASLVKEVSLSLGSILKGKLSFFSSGVSVLNAFLNHYGLTSTQVSKNVEDYFSARLVWDQVEKYTMRDFGGLTGWQTGLVTYKVTIKRLGQETYFANTGKAPYLTDRTFNEEVKSDHFDNPWATAFANGTYTVWEYISWSAGSVRYDFS